MNRLLLNYADGKDIPDRNEDYLEHFRFSCFTFNRHGNILATATFESTIALIDFDTRASARSPLVHPAFPTSKLAHKHMTPKNQNAVRIFSLDFVSPRTGPLLLASASDGSLVLWDILDGKQDSAIYFPAHLANVVSHPKCGRLAVVTLFGSFPFLVKLVPGVHFIPEINASSAPHDSTTNFHTNSAQTGVSSDLILDIFYHPDDGHRFQNLFARDPKLPVDNKKKLGANYVSAFTRKGELLLRGGPGGSIRVFRVFIDSNLDNPNEVIKVRTFCIAHESLPGRTNIEALLFTRNGKFLAVKSQDRSLRLFSTVTLQQLYKVNHPNEVNWNHSYNSSPLGETIVTFVDHVNKSQWSCICFSWNGEYLLASMHGDVHRIQIYRTADGQLEKALEGPKEGVMALTWHPRRPIILSLGAAYGGIYVWEKSYEENWAAFAPDFAELDDNEEYSEKEDEFDIKDPGLMGKVLEAQEEFERQTYLDIEDIDYTLENYSSDSDVEGSTYFYIPSVPIKDHSNALSNEHTHKKKTKKPRKA